MEYTLTFTMSNGREITVGFDTQERAEKAFDKLQKCNDFVVFDNPITYIRLNNIDIVTMQEKK